MMSKLCIVNYITLNTWHPHGQARLFESLKRSGFEGTGIAFNERNLKCTPHHETPYAFKFHAIQKAYEQGHRLILWVDASFWMIRNIKGLAEQIEQHKILTQDSDYPLGQWTSDDCLKRMSLQRKVAWDMQMFSGGFMGWDLSDEKTKVLFDKFYAYAKEGHCFRGAWRNRNKEVSSDNAVLGHRHDMCVGSILFHRHGIKIFPNNSFFSYYKWYQQYKTERDLSNVYFIIEGGPRKLPLKGLEV